jgi:hypothetical protein
MRRLGTFLIATGAVFVFGGWMLGGSGGGLDSAMAMWAVAAVTVAAGVAVRRAARGRVRRGDDSRWRGAPAPGSTPAEQASAEEQPGGFDRGRRPGRATWALGLVEARELSGSPWFAVGVGFTILELVMFGFVWSGDLASHWWEIAGSLTVFVHPFVGLVVVATHRAVTRAGRDGCDELFDTCPLDPGSRLTAHLVPGVVTAPVAMVAATGLFAALTTNGRVYGALDLRVVLMVMTCGVFGVGAVALGVALGRWAPFFLSPVIALVAIVVVDSRLLEVGMPRWVTDRYLATFDPGDGPDQLLLDLPVAERLVWFVALTVVVAAVGLWGRTRWSVPALVGGGFAAIVAATAVIAPMSDTDDAAALVADPAAHEECVAVAPPATVVVCAPAEYVGAARRYAEGVTPTGQALATLVDTRFRLRQRVLDGPVSELPAELARALPADLPHDPVTRDGAIGFGASTDADAVRAARYRLAAAALGLPTEAGPDERPTVVAGRADGVAVLWLGTLGMGDEERREALTAAPDEHLDLPADATTFGQLWPDPCVDRAAPLAWSPEDAEAATRIVGLPDDEVMSTLRAHWDDLADMTTDDLLTELGLEPVGTTSAVEDRPHVCPY